MSAKGMGRLQFIDGTVNADKYKSILERSLYPYVAEQFEDGKFIFQQDGASSHTAKTTKKWFGENNINVLSWPSSSPDLNIIETVWHEMKKRLRSSPQRTLPDLKSKIQEIWNSLTPTFCESLVETMPKRILAVIRAKGDVTQY